MAVSNIKIVALHKSLAKNGKETLFKTSKDLVAKLESLGFPKEKAHNDTVGEKEFNILFASLSDTYSTEVDINEYIDQPMYSEQASFSEVIVYKNKKMIRENAVVELYGDRVLIDDNVFPFAEITAASVLGRNKLNIYYDKKVYQLKGNKRFNAIKYVHMYYRYKNVNKGEGNEQFLGL